MGFLQEDSRGNPYGMKPRSRAPNLPDPMHRTSLLTTSHATGLGDFPSVMGIISGSHRTGPLAPQVAGLLLGQFVRPSLPAEYNPRGSHRPADGLTSRRLSSIDGAGQAVAIDRGGIVGAPRQVRMASVDMFGQGIIGNVLANFERIRSNTMRRFGL